MALEPNFEALDDPKRPAPPPEDVQIEISAPSIPGNLELVHVLFVDLVGYSKLPVDKQAEVVETLNRIIAATAHFKRAEKEHKLLLLPSGDGAAIVFWGNPADPVNCAFEIARAIKEMPAIKLRMGVNSGPVQRITDLNGKPIVAGAAINYAQRAMDCGGANHILLTKMAAEFLIESSFWSSRLHEIGDYEVKQKRVITLYNAYTEDLGNPETPTKGRRVGPKPGRLSAARIAVYVIGLLLTCGFVYSIGARLAEPVAATLVLSVAGIKPPGMSGLFYPRISSDHQWIAYASRASGKWDVYTQHFDQNGLIGSPLNLTAGREEDCTQPEFSPDGKKIAFSSDTGPVFSPDGKLKHLGSDAESGGIFIIDRATLLITRLTGGYNPAWSPDGKQIAYATESIIRPDDRVSSKSQLWVYNLDNNQQTKVYDGDGVQPVWSPSGKRLAFWYATTTGQRDIATISTDGDPDDRARVVPLTNDRYVDWSPSWSPDGYVYFSSNRADGTQFNIWRVRVDESSGQASGKPERINGQSGSAEHLSFSQDGKEVVFIQRTLNVSLYRASFDSVHFTAKPAVPVLTYQSASRPDLSSDGEWLAFNTAGAGQGEVFIARSDGTGIPENISKDDAIDQGPRWAPDGKHLAFFSNRDGNWQLWAMDLHAKTLTRLTDGHGAGFRGFLYPVWSPIDDRIAYTRRGVDASDVETQIARYDVSGQLKSKALGRFGPFESFTAWSWSHNGAAIAGYLQRQDGKFTGIAIYDFADNTFERLTHFGSDPVWLNDSRHVLFNYNGGIYLIDRLAMDRESKTVRVISLPEPSEVARRGFAISRDDQSIFFGRQVVESTLSVGHMDNPVNGTARLLETFKHYRFW
jgi:Tol biopolymer transport system component/class 3 adenylate cyclase